MVENVMIFALGFLAATLIALLVIPAINARAERLARRRVEALFPLSIPELTAEKDHLRAEFAVLQRRLERKADEALAAKHASMEELGRRALRINALEATLTESDGITNRLEVELQELLNRLARAEEELTSSSSALLETRETLAALDAAHRAALEDLSTTNKDLARATDSLTTLTESLASSQEQLEVQETVFADLDARHTAALSELDAKRITISDLETRLMTHVARGDDFERASAEHRNALSDERGQTAELSKNLIAAQGRCAILEKHIRSLERERDRDSAEVHTLKADKVALENALSTVRDERAKLERELQNIRKNGVQEDAILAENEELRRKISELADLIMRTAEKSVAPRRKGNRGTK
ncbi:hypothetical protein AB4072_15280 [Microvirga sp. 2MCAF38]|uniref:hypothetical protein n=1 Tax=Microvirga sp. 2MCAF38 TaxID=3232989 RepID=UPI003F9CCBAE